MNRDEMRTLAVEDLQLGTDELPALIAECEAVYAELAREIEEAEARKIDKTIRLPWPQLDFETSLDASAVIEVLRRGEADAELQRWIAEMIVRTRDGRGGFAARVSVWKRRLRSNGLYEAAEVDVPRIERVLRQRAVASRGDKDGPHERAMKIAAVKYRVPLGKIKSYLKHGRSDRKRITYP